MLRRPLFLTGVKRGEREDRKRGGGRERGEGEGVVKWQPG